MKKLPKLTAVISREEKHYVSLCPELDVASQGETIDEARRNLAEAVSLFVEVASEKEVARRLSPLEF